MRNSVSVIVPVFNSEQFLETAVRSALACDEVGEILLVDDGSTDGSLAECERLMAADARIRTLRHPEGVNRGVAASRNLGLAHASLDIVALLDADDYFLPHRFHREAEIFAQHPEIDGVYGSLATEFLSARGREAYQSLGFKDVTGLTQRVPPEELILVLARCHPTCRGHIQLDTLSLRRSALARSGLLEESLRLHQDTEWLLRLASTCRLVAHPSEEPVAVRSVHDSNRITAVFDRVASKLKMMEAVQTWLPQASVPDKARVALDVYYLSLRIRNGTPSNLVLKPLYFLWRLLGLRVSDPRLKDRRILKGVLGNLFQADSLRRRLSRRSWGRSG